MFSQGFSHQLIRSGIFTIELLLANIIFWASFEKKGLFWLRFLLSATVMALSGGVIFYLTRMSIFNNIISFAVCFLLSLLMAKVCFEISWADAAFCATAGYNVQFIGSIISEYIQRSFGFPRWPYEICFMAVVYAVMYYYFGRQIKKGQNLDISRLFQFFLLTVAALADIVVCGILRPYWMIPDNRSMMLCTMFLLFLSSLTILALQFSLLSRKNLADELAVVEQLMKKERSQYQFSKETIDSINRKCHDIRHQIRMIGSQAHINPDAIHEMTHAINIYDSLYKTGNQALDTILTEKALYCQDYKISINCMTDGKKLDFMRDTDIYSLFGNILENAIHAVMEVPEDERDIFLSVLSKGELLSIHSHNPYAGIVKMHDGLPVTKNADTTNHGIGTRSIQLIVEKYNGTVSFETKDGFFNVNILLLID